MSGVAAQIDRMVRSWATTADIGVTPEFPIDPRFLTRLLVVAVVDDSPRGEVGGEVGEELQGA